MCLKELGGWVRVQWFLWRGQSEDFWLLSMNLKGKKDKVLSYHNPLLPPHTLSISLIVEKRTPSFVGNELSCKVTRLIFIKVQNAQHHGECWTPWRNKQGHTVFCCYMFQQNYWQCSKPQSFRWLPNNQKTTKACRNTSFCKRRMCFNVLKVPIVRKVASPSFRQENELSSLLQVTLPLWPAMAQCSLYLVIHFQ